MSSETPFANDDISQKNGNTFRISNHESAQGTMDELVDLRKKHL